MATYEDIKKANEAITITPIKGKDYAEVNQRVKAFRMVYPEGSIKTEIISLENGVCLMRAFCADEAGNVLGVGHAYEKEGSSFINQTSYIENCETSAVGRALGMAGFGIDTSICSAEELQNAVLNQQKKPSKPKAEKQLAPEMEGTIADDPAAVKKIGALIREAIELDPTFKDGLKNMFGVEKPSDIKKVDYNDILMLAVKKIEIMKEGKNE